jgi:molecular chaperone GrpE
MRRVLHWLPETDFAREFVVDEAKLPVYPLLDTAGGSDAVAGADLLTLVARAQVENERLVALAKRLEQSQSRGADQETLTTVRTLLPVLDSFERVLEIARGFRMDEVLANWLRSVEGIQIRLLQALERVGLEPVNPLGQAVDLDRDEVVDVRPSSEHSDETVIEVRRSGYRFRGRILRDAQVVVAQNARKG